MPANPEVLVEAPGHSDGVLCCRFLGAPGWLAHQAAPSDFITSHMAEIFGFLLSRNSPVPFLWLTHYQEVMCSEFCEQ